MLLQQVPPMKNHQGLLTNDLRWRASRLYWHLSHSTPEPPRPPTSHLTASHLCWHPSHPTPEPPSPSLTKYWHPSPTSSFTALNLYWHPTPCLHDDNGVLYTPERCDHITKRATDNRAQVYIDNWFVVIIDEVIIIIHDEDNAGADDKMTFFYF